MTVSWKHLKRLAAALAVLALGACSGGGGGGGTLVVPRLSVLPTAFSVERGVAVDIVPTATNIASPVYRITVAAPDTLAGAAADQVATQFGRIQPHTVNLPGGGTGTVQQFIAGAAAVVGLHSQVTVLETTTGLRVTVPLMIVGFIQSVTIAPSTTAVQIGGTQTFTATARDIDGNLVTDTLVDWRVTGGIGTIGKDGVFHATAAGPGTVTASVGSATVASADVTVVGASAGLHVLPFADPLQVEARTSRLFGAVLRDDLGNEQPVTATWAATGTAGSITTGGVFTASATVGGSGTLTATARGQQAMVRVSVIALLTPPSGPRNLYGRVTSGGQPLAGATVQALKHSDLSLVDQTTSGADGSYSLLVPAGTYKVVATLAARSANVDNVVFDTGDVRRRVDLAVPATRGR